MAFFITSGKVYPTHDGYAAKNGNFNSRGTGPPPSIKINHQRIDDLGDGAATGVQHAAQGDRQGHGQGNARRVPSRRQKTDGFICAQAGRTPTAIFTARSTKGQVSSPISGQKCPRSIASPDHVKRGNRERRQHARTRLHCRSPRGIKSRPPAAPQKGSQHQIPSALRSGQRQDSCPESLLGRGLV